MDKIIIKDLEIYAYHGVYDEEKKRGQTFIITAELGLDLRDAGMTDDLTKTVNYAEVCELISNVMLEEKYNLIEAAAENIANTILIKYDRIKTVRIIVGKPEAPIDMSFDTVCVDITRRKNIAYLSIGSNMGDKEGYLDFAVDQLNKDEYIRVERISSYIETEPYGDVEQENFLNACLEIETLY
ncbi:MAG: dihydroneopterin aldolase, partial [Lachnospiraceae bacterium]|nr:dihydroneopterin aldolase [Lachnospiraceae bacterium]